ncbi:MAG: threonine--tRNA ligase [Patescibacteria group bacterium]|jgi:threonyl-tRNA synthetase
MDKEKLESMRHSCEHVLTMAMMRLWPGQIKAAMGPATEEGFYFDFDTDLKITEDDFAKIEKEMGNIIKENLSIMKDEMTIEEARKFFGGNTYKDNEYKHEWLDLIEARNEKISVYWMGKKGEDMPQTFVDICSGPHLESTGQIGAFKLLKTAGAYWHGDEKNKMLSRIYGTAFETQEDLDSYLAMLEEAKKRDHRKLGVELDLFAFSPLVGSGLPLFTPRGTVLREQLVAFVWALMKPYGYTKVTIPHMAKSDLYKTSGHWDKFADDIFHVTSKKTDDTFVLKPMNCPHHTQIYASRSRSYRDLPLRFSEVTAVYRDENTGQLQGLSRVRSITQDDAHVFCRLDQVKDEARAIVNIITKFYEAFQMPLKARLSVNDPEKPEAYLGGAEVWEKAVGTLKELLAEMNRDYFLGIGEAAFYGPKIDFIATDAIGREWQLATIQLDFNLPERFELEYVDAENTHQRPVMIHRAILGSIERFIGVMIEHYAGAFPMWLAPEQVRLATVADEYRDAAQSIKLLLEAADIRVTLDDSSEKVGKKIRDAAMNKVPWTIVVGAKERDGGDIQVKVFGSEEAFIIPQADLVAKAIDASKLPV